MVQIEKKKMAPERSYYLTHGSKTYTIANKANLLVWLQFLKHLSGKRL